MLPTADSIRPSCANASIANTLCPIDLIAEEADAKDFRWQQSKARLPKKGGCLPLTDPDQLAYRVEDVLPAAIASR